MKILTDILFVSKAAGYYYILAVNRRLVK